MKDFDVQVGSDHYYDDYNSFVRFASFYHQIINIEKNKPSSIFEIGVGNNTLSNYLRGKQYNVTTCDFDKKLNPDIVADISNCQAM